MPQVWFLLQALYAYKRQGVMSFFCFLCDGQGYHPCSCCWHSWHRPLLMAAALTTHDITPVLQVHSINQVVVNNSNNRTDRDSETTELLCWRASRQATAVKCAGRSPRSNRVGSSDCSSCADRPPLRWPPPPEQVADTDEAVRRCPPPPLLELELSAAATRPDGLSTTIN